MHTDIFTVAQAAALWCGYDPSRLSGVDQLDPPEFVAVKQMLAGAIIGGQLIADDSRNALNLIGKHDDSLVKRADLEAFAKSRDLFPAFLFDTLAPFPEKVFRSNVTAATPTVAPIPVPPPPNKGGRPAEYDWDSFTMEIIHRANTPDGLPDTQAELTREMLSWFSDTCGHEPAESSVKVRISKIYSYLASRRS